MYEPLPTSSRGVKYVILHLLFARWATQICKCVVYVEPHLKHTHTLNIDGPGNDCKFLRKKSARAHVCCAHRRSFALLAALFTAMLDAAAASMCAHSFVK